jgi:hypothetical protein
MAVAQSRLSCADPSEHTFWSTPTWAREGTSGVAVLRETAVAAHERSKSLPPGRLPDASLFIDLHLTAMLALEKLVSQGQADDVASLFKTGSAPEQIDPRTLLGHYCGCLKHSAEIVRAVSLVQPGRQVTADLLHKAMAPDDARVRYVDSNAIEAVKEDNGVLRRLLTIAVFGGVPGGSAIASVETRLLYWDDPVAMTRLIISKLMKRGILLALAEAISRLPCALLQSVVTVRIQGNVCSALFSESGAPKSHIRVAHSGLTAKHGPDRPPVPELKCSTVPPEVILDGVVRFGTVGSTALPKTRRDLAMLGSVAARGTKVCITHADPAVRTAQIKAIGLATVNFCVSCHTVHGISAAKVSKAQRVVTVYGPTGPVCSGCGSGSVVRLDLTGRVMQLRGPKCHALLAPCTECAAIGPIAAMYGDLPFCEKHSADLAAAQLDSGPLRCAICSTFVHGANDSVAIECEDDLHRLCLPCHSILPTTRWTKSELELLRSRKGSRA